LPEPETGTTTVSRSGRVCDGRETVAITIPTRQLRGPTVARARGVVRETATVRVAFAVIAQHLVDDAFVHPESGSVMCKYLPQLAVGTLATAEMSNGIPPPDLVDLVPRIAPQASFLMYARDGVGSEPLNRTNYTRAAPPKALWEIPVGGHTGGLSSRPREYQRRVLAFFDATLLWDR
jgi:hypothetical protein